MRYLVLSVVLLTACSGESMSEVILKHREWCTEQYRSGTVKGATGLNDCEADAVLKRARLIRSPQETELADYYGKRSVLAKGLDARKLTAKEARQREDALNQAYSFSSSATSIGSGGFFDRALLNYAIVR